MAVQLQVRRGTAAQWAATDPTPAIGEPCYETDTNKMKIGDGVTIYSLLPYWPESAAAEQRIEYGNVLLATRAGTPAANRVFQNWGGRFFNDIYENPTTYMRCHWDIWEDPTSGGTGRWEGQRFATLADLYQFLDVNCQRYSVDPNLFEHSIYACCYDIVDTSMTRINKVYGMNTFFSMLKGSHKYKTGAKSVDINNVNWTQFQTWFAELCNQNMGFGSGTTWSPGAERALWLPRTSVKMYGLPRNGFACENVMPPDRWVWDWGSSDFSQIPAPGTYTHNTGAATNQIWCFINHSNPSAWTWATSATAAMNLCASAQTSGIALYRMVSGTREAIYIKPVGIDRAGVSWFDTTQYDLEVLYRRMDRSPIITQISTGAQDKYSDMCWVSKSQWAPRKAASDARLAFRRTGMEMEDVKFFLRDRTSGKISVPSEATLRGSQGHRNAPFKWLVRRS